MPALTCSCGSAEMTGWAARLSSVWELPLDSEPLSPFIKLGAFKVEKGFRNELVEDRLLVGCLEYCLDLEKVVGITAEQD